MALASAVAALAAGAGAGEKPVTRRYSLTVMGTTDLQGHVASAQELWSESTEIRTRISEWVTARGVLDPKDFAAVDWKPARNGTPVF